MTRYTHELEMEVRDYRLPDGKPVMTAVVTATGLQNGRPSIPAVVAEKLEKGLGGGPASRPLPRTG